MLRDSYTRYPRPILWLVRGGKATIGGAEDDARPRFEVEVEPFYIGKFPVTNEQFEAFDPGFERAATSAGDRDPAAGVSFEAARAYCQWYAGVSRKPMRLPSEVEWEYACRGGVAGKTYFGDAPAGVDVDAQMWHAGNSEGRVGDEPVGDSVWHAGNSEGRVHRLDARPANEYGLYGMLGGVWEWTSSLYRPYPLSEPFGDDGSASGRRVLRGGSFRLDGAETSCSLRRAADPAARRDDVGFRIVKSFR